MDEPEAFHIVKPGLLAHQVRDQIRQRILDGTLAPGEVIKDSVLATTMGISRSPVREALRMLEKVGLVEKTPNRSYTVSQASSSDEREYAALRLADETLAVRLVVASRVPLTSLHEIVDAMHEARSQDDPARMEREDARFHREVVHLTGMSKLITRYAELADQIALALASTRRVQADISRAHAERHRQLVEHLEVAQRTQDARPALAIWEDHILRGMHMPELIAPIVPLEAKVTYP